MKLIKRRTAASTSAPDKEPSKTTGPSAHKTATGGRKMKRFLKIGSVRSVIAILVSLCAIALADAATRDLERVRIGYSVGGLIPFPLIVAKENRFFEQAGLDVELINIPPTIAVTALISGDIQYVILAGTTLNA